MAFFSETGVSRLGLRDSCFKKIVRHVKRLLLTEKISGKWKKPSKRVSHVSAVKQVFQCPGPAYMKAKP
jgi:hypothetical protein